MYEKLNFRTGQVLAADDLNHMEEGIAAAMNAGGIIAITWSELRELRNNKSLKAGSFYRITDYVTTTAQENTRSAGHQFDIVVLALSNNVLAEKAYATLHEGDIYFSEAGANLAAWQIWYNLDNSKKYAWADSTNGRGVIYRMIDEWNNDCPYDFKNIIYMFSKSFMYSQWGGEHEFIRDLTLDKVINGTQYYGYYSKTTPSAWQKGSCWVTDVEVTSNTQLYNEDGSDISYGGSIYNISNNEFESYTFNEGKLNDYSLEGTFCYGNTIKAWERGLNRICFKNEKGQGDSLCYSNSFGNGCYNNSVGNGCYNNSVGNGCYSNSFGNDCYSNSFGNDCYSNSFGNVCYFNSFDGDCSGNSFSNACSYNILSSGCNYNSFDNYCGGNSFGETCIFNSLGNECHDNIFSNECRYNSFGNGCENLDLQDTSYCTASVASDRGVKVFNLADLLNK